MPIGGFVAIPGQRNPEQLALTSGPTLPVQAPNGYIDPYAPQSPYQHHYQQPHLPQAPWYPQSPQRPASPMSPMRLSPGPQQFQGMQPQFAPAPQGPKRWYNRLGVRMAAGATAGVLLLGGLVAYADWNTDDVVAAQSSGGGAGEAEYAETNNDVVTGILNCKDGTQIPYVAAVGISTADLEAKNCVAPDIIKQIKKDANTPMVANPWDRPAGTSRTSGCNKYQNGERIFCESLKYLDIYYGWAGGHSISYENFVKGCPNPQEPIRNNPHGGRFYNGNPGPCAIDCSGLIRMAIFDSYTGVRRDWVVESMLGDSKNFKRKPLDENLKIGDIVMKGGSRGDQHVELVISTTRSKKNGKLIINTIGTRKTGTLSSFYSDSYVHAREFIVPAAERI